MIETLRNHLIARLGNNVEGLDNVLALFQPVATKRNQALLKEGDPCKYVYFIAKGSLQVYVYDSAFNENTRDIVVENNWCSELVSFASGKPSAENIRSIEPSDLLRISRTNFQPSWKQFPNLIPCINKFLKHLMPIPYIVLTVLCQCLL